MKQNIWILSLTAMVMLAMGSCGKQQQESEGRAPIKVGVTTIQQEPVDGVNSYSGTIEEMASTALSLPMGGTVKAIHVAEGQMVSQGQLVATADASSLGNSYEMARSTTQQAQDALAQAQDAYNRMKQLHDNGAITELQWVDIQTKVSQAQSLLRQAQAGEKIAQKAMTDTKVVAPFSGFISQKNAEVGQNLLPGQSVVKLVKIDRVNIKIAVPEEEISTLKKGDKIRGSVAALNDYSFEGVVTEKAVTADLISRSYTVKAVVNNPNHKLLPGMVCNALVTKENTAMAVQIPANIVQIDEKNNTFVWTVVGGKAHRTPITLGKTAGANVIVAGGLKAGDQLITAGQQKVSEGMAVTTK